MKDLKQEITLMQTLKEELKEELNENVRHFSFISSSSSFYDLTNWLQIFRIFFFLLSSHEQSTKESQDKRMLLELKRERERLIQENDEELLSYDLQKSNLHNEGTYHINREFIEEEKSSKIKIN